MRIKYRNLSVLWAILVYLLTISGPAKAMSSFQQGWPLDVAKGKFVVLKIPSRLIGFEKVNFWSGVVNYGTVIEQSGKTGIMVGGLTDWRNAGWPLMRQLTVEKVSHNNRLTEIQFNDPLYNIKLRFDSTVKDINQAFHEIAFVGLLSEFEASEYYQQEVIGKVLPKIFTGQLASIPTKAKLRMLQELKYIDSAIKTEKYKGDTYLAVDVGGDVEVYNTLRTDQSQRIAHTLNQRVLSYFKRIARTIKFHSEVDGIKVSILIPYKDFLSEAYISPHYDRLEMYAPMDVIRQFADDELTNQEFAEEATLLINGNRTRVPEMESL